MEGGRKRGKGMSRPVPFLSVCVCGRQSASGSDRLEGEEHPNSDLGSHRQETIASLTQPGYIHTHLLIRRLCLSRNVQPDHIRR